MSVGGVFRIACAVIVDEDVFRDPRRDDKGRDADTEAGEVVGDVVLVRDSGEGHVVTRSRDADWGRDMVCKASVLVEVDDEKAIRASVAIDANVKKEKLTRYPSIAIF